MNQAGHAPVMLDAVLEVLNPRDGGIYVDGTFGGGGYSKALLAAADCTVWGIDQDPEACARGNAIAANFDGRLCVLQGRFGDMDTLLAAHDVGPVDGVALDIGVSSFQLDDQARGFSFREDGPLDMRMSKTGPSAADIVNSMEETPLADLIFRYGEERRSRRIARAIVAARDIEPIENTKRLADIVRRCYPPRHKRANDGIDPATRTFQALRIYVNDELGELSRGLAAAETILATGGRLAVVSFHSLEDRIVKNFLNERAGETPGPSRHAPAPTTDGPAPSFTRLARRIIRPGKDEIAANPRARSARMRAGERTAAAPWHQRAEALGGQA
jgi:16S rRNA (cytosine1402-N4)-methyltransferase